MQAPRIAEAPVSSANPAAPERALAGALSDGREVQSVVLRSGGLEAQVWAFGAAIQALRVARPGGGSVQVLPNPHDLSALEVDGAYHARVIGRVANRIGGARFTLDGRTYATDPNEHGSTLHGGSAGWSLRLWRFESVAPDRCILAYDSPDGEGGFPGRVLARTHVSLLEDATMELRWEAQAHAPTPLAMTHHLYFNLSGQDDADTLDHRLRIAASAITEVDARLVPTGALLPVAGTVLDLREGRRMGDIAAADHPQLRPGGGLDLNYVLDRPDDAVMLSCPASGLALHISTDQPGCQVYGGQGLQAPMIRYGGVALEPQAFPDAVNNASFPSVIVRPGERYERSARYRFAWDG